MAVFHGKIGYAEPTETAPGVWEDTIKEYDYRGQVLRISKRWVGSEGLSDNLVLNSQFSVVGDAMSWDNFPMMRYIIYNKTKWKITSVEIQRPRVIVSVGGVYNGP